MHGRFSTFCALLLLLLSPNPNSPQLLFPQTQGVPSSSRNKECLQPAVMDFIGFMGNFTGVRIFCLNFPNDNSPLTFEPQAHTLCASSRNNECLSKEAATEIIFGSPEILVGFNALVSDLISRPSSPSFFRISLPQLYTFPL